MYSTSHLSTTKHPCIFSDVKGTEQHDSFSITHSKWRTHTAGSCSDDTQMTCIWHDQHQARDISVAAPALVCAELVVHCLLCLTGTPGSERGLFSRYTARPRLAGRQQTPPPTAVGMKPQKCCVCSVWGLLTVAKRAVGTQAGLLCACYTANMLHGQSAYKPHHPPQKKKKEKL